MPYVQFNTTQTMKLGSGYSAELSGFFQSRSLFGLLVRRPFGSLNIGIQKELKNNLGTLKLSGEDLLWTQIHRFKSYNSELGFEADFEIKLNSRLIRFTYSRNFGSKNVKSVKRATGSEEERKRVQ
ncbi:hypothetical protein BH23BAC1_BH23BAC1_06180 [soil metagenome]